MKRHPDKKGRSWQTGFSREIGCEHGLPICQAWDRLMDAIRHHQVVIVTGDTGSGKSTQLPKLCLAAGRARGEGHEGRRSKGRRRPGIIGVTQPRRIAATSIARRVAQELSGAVPAGTVGYKIRFHDRTGPETRIKFMTDGILLSELQSDRLLRAYDTIIVDEAHERSLNIDFILGMLKKILPRRPELKLIITSATMDVERIAKAFSSQGKEPPVISVEGRSHPVEILYRPYDHLEGSEDLSMVDKAAMAVGEIRSIDPFGDILVFMPTEADINQLVKVLKGRLLKEEAEVLPLFGRLASSVQERIFRPSSRQKIIVATNIAETSITVPGIRYVVDSGLARISRYNINTHTSSLPVTRISRASAAQRAGRAGRVEAGICIRLYSREDFEDREEFTPPEILRCNLAEVVLRLISMGQVPVEEFPFVDPPSPRAIKEALHTLIELGAITERRDGGRDGPRLTRKGRQMARLPLDPRISAIILQARHEGCLPHALIVAAALSIQDPRQYPAENEQAARQAHARFTDPRSDFLTLIRIWNGFQELRKGASRSRQRAFCRKHFLSWSRMNEWTDLVRQLAIQLSELGIKVPAAISGPAPEADKALCNALHRSILAGFLGNLAMKRPNSHAYQGTKGKELYIFPGSVLFKAGPKWIVSAEQVRTTRLFARFAAPVDPAWAEGLARHLCRYTYGEPHWSRTRGEALVVERVTLYGLPIVEARRIGLKKIDPEQARSLFIREGLACHDLKGRYRFMEQNVRLLREIREIEERTRSRQFVADQEVVEGFYAERLRSLEEAWGRMVTDEASFRRALRQTGLEEKFLLTRDLILKQRPAGGQLRQFPGRIKVRGHELPLTYRFAPGDEKDGITCRIPVTALKDLDQEPFDWLVPGMIQEKVEFILKNLPGAMRKRVVPVPQTAEEAVKKMAFRKGPLIQALKEALCAIKALPPQSFPLEQAASGLPYPDHLLMRFEIVDLKGRVIASGRDLRRLKERFHEKAEQEALSHPAWKAARKKWHMPIDEKAAMAELPKRIQIHEAAGLYAYPGLVVKDGAIYVDLFQDEGQAERATGHALLRLLERRLKKELRHIELGLERGSLLKGTGSKRPLPKHLRANCLNLIKRSAFLGALKEAGGLDSLSGLELDIALLERQMRSRLYSRAQETAELVAKALEALDELQGLMARRAKELSRYPAGAALMREVESDIALLFPDTFPDPASAEILDHLPRFLKAMALRIERACHSPSKDRKKAERIAPLVERATECLKGRGLSPEERPRERAEAISALMELKVQVYAPELFIKGKRPERTLKGFINIPLCSDSGKKMDHGRSTAHPH